MTPSLIKAVCIFQKESEIDIERKQITLKLLNFFCVAKDTGTQGRVLKNRCKTSLW